MTMLDVLDDPNLLGPLFVDPSWRAWKAALGALFGLSIPEVDEDFVRRCTGRTRLPTAPAREGWFVVGRRGGKSRVMAAVAVYLACLRAYRLAPGERGVVMLLASDRRQARVLRRYCGGILDRVPMLRALVDTETAESIALRTGIDIEIHTASFRSTRGYTVLGAICDELAFWPTDDAADPDREILAALRPAMATIPDALLLAISSPYSRRGELWRAYDKHFGRDDDPVLVWQASTRDMNPTVSLAVIDAALAEDEPAARAEYFAEFRRDVESFVSLDVLDAATMPGRAELPPVAGVPYVAFTDPAGGAGADSFTLAIGHQEQRNGRTIAVLDAIREQKPPFSPADTVAAFAATLRRYGVFRVAGDRYAGSWPAEQFQRHGITYDASPRTKSDLYLAAIPMLTSGSVELLDHARLLGQIGALERRTARGGRDSVDHPPRGRDDVANAALASLVLAAEPPRTAYGWAHSPWL